MSSEHDDDQMDLCMYVRWCVPPMPSGVLAPGELFHPGQGYMKVWINKPTNALLNGFVGLFILAEPWPEEV